MKEGEKRVRNNRARGLLCLIGVITALAGCAPATMTPNITDEAALKEMHYQQEIALKEMENRNQRLQDVARPLLTANVDLCGQAVAPYTGMFLQTEATAPKDFKAAMGRVYGLDKYPTVIMLTKGSPAAKVLQVGDVITQVNGKSLKTGKAGLQAIKDTEEAMDAAAPLNLSIRRKGTEQTVAVKMVMACDDPMIYENDDQVNAYADGTAIHINKGIMNFAKNDTELAIVIGHELAHNTRGHMEARQGNALIGTLLGAAVTVATGVDVTRLGSDIGAGAHAQGFESEADYVGLYLTARAGYPIDEAPLLWRRMGADNPESIHLEGSDHPSTAKRYLALDATVKEIKAKQAKGQPLVPEEKKQRDFEGEQKEAGLNN